MLKRAGVKERWGYRSDFRAPAAHEGRPPAAAQGAAFRSTTRISSDSLGIETGPLTAQLELPPAIAARGVDAAARSADGRRISRWSASHPARHSATRSDGSPARYCRAGRSADVNGELGAACVILGRSGRSRLPATGRATAIDLIGQTDLPMLMGVLSHCRALVANDSGALHLAAALGVPVAGIYGPTDERYSTPLTPSEDARSIGS